MSEIRRDYVITWQGVDLVMSKKTIEGLINRSATLEKELDTLKAQLKRERDCVEFYARNETWVNEDDRISITYVDHFRRYPGDVASGGKLARETVKARGYEFP